MSLNPSPPPPLKDCRTCNRRRIKCDRTIPTCQKCSSRSLECPGYGMKYRWVDGTTTRRRPKNTSSPIENIQQETSNSSTYPSLGFEENASPESSMSLATWNTSSNTSMELDTDITHQPPNSPQALNSLLHLNFTPSILSNPSDHHLLHHYFQTTSTQLAWVDSLENPWQTIVLQLALESPALLHSILALAAGDLSDRLHGCADSATDTLYGFTRNRDKALSLITSYLKQDALQQTQTPQMFSATFQEPPNAVLATMVVLCYHEIKWPPSGLWKIHFQGARLILQRWASERLWSNTNDPICSFLGQELFATSAMASVTSFPASGELEEQVQIRMPGTETASAPFLGFLHAIKRTTEIERKRQLGAGIGDEKEREVVMGKILKVLTQAREHAFTTSQTLSFRSHQSFQQFNHIVEIFYHACTIYLYQVSSPSPSHAHSSTQTISQQKQTFKTQLFAHLHALKNTSLFSQDLPWPLFIAGTECYGQIEEQEFVEGRMREMVAVSGTLDRLNALRFLKEFWGLGKEENEVGSWLALARRWAERGDGFLIW